MITNLIDLIITYTSKDHSKNLHFCAILYYSINTQNKVNNKKICIISFLLCIFIPMLLAFCVQ